MAAQSENERNKALVDEYYKAGVQDHLSSFAAYLRPDVTVTAPNYLPWGGRHVGAAFFRDHLLKGVADVFDFARFSCDNGLLLRSGDGRRNCLSSIAPRGSANIGRPAFVRPHVVRARLHEREGRAGRWRTTDRSP